MEQKNWYLSKTIWGAMIMLIATILKGAGVLELSPAEQDQLTNQVYNLAFAGSELVGFVLVIVGRIQAKKQIK